MMKAEERDQDREGWNRLGFSGRLVKSFCSVAFASWFACRFIFFVVGGGGGGCVLFFKV
jgi:hypothetical protein